MNNQAAQKMPELPARVFFAAPSEGYTAAQMHQYARDYAAALSKTAGAPFGHAMFNAKGACVGFRQNHGFGYNFTVADFLRADEIMPDGAPHTGCLVYAAAPAASGGEDDSLTAAYMLGRYDGRKATTADLAQAQQNPNPPAGASVSERARSSMKLLRFGRGNGATPWILEPHVDGYWTPWHTAQSELDMAVESSTQLERALEQALTQQRVAVKADPIVIEAVAAIQRNSDGDLYVEWLLEGGIHGLENGDVLMVSATDLTNDEGYGEVYTTPQPGAEALRELVQRWRDRALYAWEEVGPQEAREDCADQLESLLARGAE